MSDAMRAKARRLAIAFRNKLPIDICMKDRWRSLYLGVTAQLFLPPSGVLYVQGANGAVFPLKLGEIGPFITLERVTETRIHRQQIHPWVDVPMGQLSRLLDFAAVRSPERTVRQTACGFYANAIHRQSDAEYFLRRWLVAWGLD